MAVQARFFVQTITKNAYAKGAQNVKLSPVSRGEVNKAWAYATPSGSIELNIGNPDAAKWFEDRLGQEVAITFDDRPADEVAAG